MTGLDCTGECKRLPSIFGVRGLGGPTYADGRKTCMSCRISIKYDGLYCPCCGTRLRMGSQSGPWRRKRVGEAFRH